MMFVVLYRWKVKKGMEDQFVEAWSEITSVIVNRFDSLGSRLHLGEDNIWYAYAQWRSESDRANAFNLMPPMDAAQKMRDSIQQRFDDVILDVKSDLLIHVKPEIE